MQNVTIHNVLKINRIALINKYYFEQYKMSIKGTSFLLNILIFKRLVKREKGVFWWAFIAERFIKIGCYSTQVRQSCIAAFLLKPPGNPFPHLTIKCSCQYNSKTSRSTIQSGFKMFFYFQILYIFHHRSSVL